MFGALQLCERVCNKCHIRRYITSWFEKHGSNITKNTSRYSGTISLVIYLFSAANCWQNVKKCKRSLLCLKLCFVMGLYLDLYRLPLIKLQGRLAFSTNNIRYTLCCLLIIIIVCCVWLTFVCYKLISLLYLLLHREWMRQPLLYSDSIYLIMMSLTSWPKIKWIHPEFTKERGYFCMSLLYLC